MHKAVGCSVPFSLFVVVGCALLVSGVSPFDRTVWLAEVMPVLIGLPLLLATRPRFPLTLFAYFFLAAFALVLIVGGAYTYARVPLGELLQDFFGLARNPYDRIGHFFQGVTPAIVARELLLRTSPLRRGKWLFFIVLSIALAISACYELIEWGAAVVWGDGASDFLGTQGDPWDAQWDMLTALLGAMLAQLLLVRFHDQQLLKLGLLASADVE